MTSFYFVRVAFQNALRSGQRGIVALLCIAFGVMSLVAMLLVAETINHMVALDPRLQYGADAMLTRAEHDAISPAVLAQLDALQARGVIQNHTAVALASALMFRVPQLAQAHFISAGIGVTPPGYPLIGEVTFAEPRAATLASVLRAVGDVVVTRDIATAQQLHVGDTLVLSDLARGIPVTARVRGILQDTPAHEGGRMYYTVATSEALVGGPALDTVFVTTKAVTPAAELLKASGWSVTTMAGMANSNREGRDLVNLLLKGAGVLALLVGGIGIANTMQVLLQRRRKEVAIWKTLGYRTQDLYVLFAAEAALFGIVGSVTGAALGLFMSFLLIDLFGRTTELLFAWTFSPLPLLVGMLAGIVTTILFALWAIVLVSRVQPMSLLRNETVDAARVPWWQSAGLALALAVPFAILTSWIMGTPVQGVGVIAFAIVGTAVLAVVLGGLGWLATRLLPFGRIPLFQIARNSLRRRGASLLFAMMALLVGVIALAFGLVFTQNAGREMDTRSIRLEGYNTVIIAPAAQQATVLRALSPSQTAILSQTSVRAIRGTGEYADQWEQPELVVATEPYNYKLTGAAWGEQPDGVYIDTSSHISTGSQIEIVLSDGTRVSKKVIGRYSIKQNPTTMWTSFGPLLQASANNKIVAPETVRIYAELDAPRLQQISATLQDATVIDIAAYAVRFTQAYENLYILAVVMAGLALLAGMLLIANAVGLAMLDRRYEIGVLKTIGYTTRHVLLTLVVEYGIIALLVSGVGIAVVQIWLLFLGRTNNLAARLIYMTGQDALTISAVTLLATLFTVLAVIWKPVRTSPIFILNDRT